MKSHSIPKTLAHIRKIVQNETGQDLSRHALRELEIALVATDIHKSNDDEADFQQREVTILLADLRGFTAIAAEMTSSAVIQMLNRDFPLDVSLGLRGCKFAIFRLFVTMLRRQ